VVEAFGESAFFKESGFDRFELLVEQVVGLVNQTNQNGGADFGFSCFPIGPIGRLGPILLSAEFPDKQGHFGISGPQF